MRAVSQVAGVWECRHTSSSATRVPPACPFVREGLSGHGVSGELARHYAVRQQLPTDMKTAVLGNKGIGRPSYLFYLVLDQNKCMILNVC